jgi:glycerophosphoryl diester phosphodiesterase
MPRPEIIAHRGTPRVHPENSLPGFAHALALGVDGIELDVHLTRDGVPVVHHDPDLGGRGPLVGRAIVDLSLDELRAHELAPGVGVPMLADICALTDGRATLYVEVKRATPRTRSRRGSATAGRPLRATASTTASREVRRARPGDAVGVLSGATWSTTWRPCRRRRARPLAALVDDRRPARGRGARRARAGDRVDR